MNALRALPSAHEDVAALDLHIEALLFAKAGDLVAASTSFAAAQAVELLRGFADGALHTAHQMALTANFRGDLTKLDQYYHETTITLTKMRNRKGVALCLRSVGEIAIIKRDSSELERAWELSERLFVMTNSPEASQVALWRRRVREALAAP